MSSPRDTVTHEVLFDRLERSLQESIDPQYFNEPQNFRSLVEVLNVLGEKVDKMDQMSGDELLAALKEANPAYSKLLEQQHLVQQVVEEVVRFQHGGLNSTVETMTDVLKEYNRGRTDIRDLRMSLAETQEVLTAKKSGQMSMRDLWLKKAEAEFSLKILHDLRYLRDISPTINRMINRDHYFTAVKHLNNATSKLFSEDLVGIRGLSNISEQLMEMKGTLLENIVLELQYIIVGFRDINIVFSSEPAQAEIEEISMEEFDLSDALDEKKETSPEIKSISLEIRFLIKALGGLSYEEDGERMVLDSTIEQYEIVTKKIRDKALTRRNKMLRELYDLNSTDAEVIERSEKDMFLEYVQYLLLFSQKLLEKLLYVLKLGSHMLEVRSTAARNGIPDEFEYTLKNKYKAKVLKIWNAIENMLISELRMHFVDKSIGDISDIASHTPTKPRLGLDKNEDAEDILHPIFSTSAQMASPIYSDIQKFSTNVSKLLVSENVIEKDRKSDVLIMLDKFLEADLFPLVQLGANTSLREIQMNNELFCMNVIEAEFNRFSTKQSFAEARENTSCKAAYLCANAFSDIFVYWLELRAHDEVLVIILERLIIGFVSAAKDEMESLCWKFLSFNNDVKKQLKDHVKESMEYKSYATGNYGKFIEDVAGLSNISQSKSTEAIPGICADEELDIWKSLGLWDVSKPFGDYPTISMEDRLSEKITNTKIASDFTILKHAASILRGCDWLGNELCLFCDEFLQRDVHINKTQRDVRFGNGIGNNNKAPEKKDSELMQELAERKALLQHCVSKSASDLSSCALENMAILRGEAQIACFHHLYPLVRLALGASEEDSLEADAHIATFGRYLSQYHASIKSMLPPSALIVVFSPLIKLMPKVFLACLMQVVKSGLAPPKTNNRTRLLKIVGACEKSLAVHFESIGVSHDTLYEIQEALSVEFEHARDFVTLLDVPVGELGEYMREYLDEYSAEEFYVLYARLNPKVSRKAFEENILKPATKAFSTNKAKNEAATAAVSSNRHSGKIHSVKIK